MKQLLGRIGGYLGIQLEPKQITLLETYRDWLVTEAIPAGGLGPAEADRVELRHIGDSIVFGRFLPPNVTEVWDVGSGSGLPGLPLAIVYPKTEFRLIDRSGRRVDLLHRAIRVLGLVNCSVTKSDIYEIEDVTEAIVSRASFPPADLTDWAMTHLLSGGRVVIGGSWVGPHTVSGWKTVEIPEQVLDRPVWIHMMQKA